MNEPAQAGSASVIVTPTVEARPGTELALSRLRASRALIKSAMATYTDHAHASTAEGPVPTRGPLRRLQARLRAIPGLLLALDTLRSLRNKRG